MAMPSAALVPNSDDTIPRGLVGDRACEGGVEEPVEPGSEKLEDFGLPTFRYPCPSSKARELRRCDDTVLARTALYGLMHRSHAG
jgi:hypothetical protein